MMPWLVLRPEPGATATAQAIAALGRIAIKAPLFTIRPLDFAAPDVAQHDALLLTSANAVRELSGSAASLKTLPAYAVGQATATAAREGGFDVVHAGDDDAAALIARAAADGRTRLLHPAGREHRVAEHPGVTITRAIVYASEPASILPMTARAGLALLHSSRAAAVFADLLDKAGLSHDAFAVAALSPAVAQTAGGGWRAQAVAEQPNDAALLAAAARLCETLADWG